MAEEAADRLGGLDVLCANAGVYPERTLDEINVDDVDVDHSPPTSTGPSSSVQACRSGAAKSPGEAAVVVTSSITGPITGYAGLSHYGASKAAQLGFVRTAALELAADGITVNAVLPGSIRTEGLDGLGAAAIEKMEACIPQRRLGSPADIASAAIYFASEEAGFVPARPWWSTAGRPFPNYPKPFWRR